MANEYTYSNVEDMLLGDITPGISSNQESYVTSARDEIDSMIGFRYVTPLNIDETVDGQANKIVRPARLLIKRISVHLSSGRFLMAQAAPSEDDNVHAYGARLVRDALVALNQIANGATDLTGAELVDGEVVDAVAHPIIGNLDHRSRVEQFYDEVANPRVLGPGYVK